jgi:hypothetical protein
VGPYLSTVKTTGFIATYMDEHKKRRDQLKNNHFSHQEADSDRDFKRKRDAEKEKEKSPVLDR